MAIYEHYYEQYVKKDWKSVIAVSFSIIFILNTIAKAILIYLLKKLLKESKEINIVKAGTHPSP